MSWRAALFATLMACGPSTAPTVVVTQPTASSVAPVVTTVPAKPQHVAVPAWIAERIKNGAATSLVGGDANSIELLYGQFEHPEEAIVRVDRKTGCALEVIGPWPTLSTIVRGRSGKATGGPRMPVADLLKLANGGELEKELRTIVPVYTNRRNQGEEKVVFSLDGKHIVMEATDEHLIASADSGKTWQLLDGSFTGMPELSPDGHFALVRSCTSGTCGAPPKIASYRPGLVAFDLLPKVKILAGSTLHDVVFDTDSASMLITRSDAFGKPNPTKLCFERYAPIDTATPKVLACVPTSVAGYWHMISVSPDRRTAAFPAVSANNKVRISMRSLLDGTEKEAFDVPGDWEKYQWVDVKPNDRGNVALADRAPNTGDPFGAPTRAAGSILLRGGGMNKTIPNARALGWLSNHELVVSSLEGPADPHGCGRTKVVDVDTL